MIHGRGGGSGKYSYRYASWGRGRAQVSHMPEDGMRVRIRIDDELDETQTAMTIHECMAEALWSALSAMAKDLKWDDRMPNEERDP